MTASSLAGLVFGAAVVVAVAIPGVLGWRGHTWRGVGVVVLGWWVIEAVVAVPLYRADQECLATPGCESWSGIGWTLLIAAGIGYPLVAAAVVGIASWARRRRPV